MTAIQHDSVLGRYRCASVRYPRYLRLGRVTPVLVVLSAREPAQPGANATQQAEGIAITPGAAVEVELVLPGCTVYPNGKRQLDSNATVSHVRFDVIAHVTGPVTGGRACWTQNGQTIAEMPLEMTARRAWPVLLTSAATTLFTLFAFVSKHLGVDFGAFGWLVDLMQTVLVLTAVLEVPLWVWATGAIGSLLGGLWFLRPRDDRFFDLTLLTPEEDAHARVEAAYSAVCIGNVSRVELLLGLLATDHPRFAPGWFLLGDWRADRGHWRGALEAFRHGLALSASAPPVVYAKAAVAAARVRDFPRALAWVTTGLSQARQSGDLRGVMLYNRGCYLSQLGRPDEAEKALTAAVTAGFVDPRRYRTDRDLDPLRGRPRFRTILAELSHANS